VTGGDPSFFAEKVLDEVDDPVVSLTHMSLLPVDRTGQSGKLHDNPPPSTAQPRSGPTGNSIMAIASSQRTRGRGRRQQLDGVDWGAPAPCNNRSGRRSRH
jgi:hypothetical protein